MEFLRQYEILYKKAKADLKAAKVLLENFEGGNDELDLETIMFHLQQCAEKIIKTYLDFNKIKFPHTHDLKELINLLEDHNINFIDDVDSIVLLTQYAVEGRYAVIHDNLEDGNRYIHTLNELLEFVRREIE